MSEQPTPQTGCDVVVHIPDGAIFTFIDATVGTLNMAEYKKLVTRMVASDCVRDHQKAKLIVTAIQMDRPEHLTVLLSLGIGITDANGVVHKNHSYALSLIQSKEIAHILLKSVLDMTDVQFEDIKQYYKVRSYDMGNFHTLYDDSNNYADLTKFFIRLGMLPRAATVPFTVMIMCGRSHVYADNTKEYVLAMIAIMDDYERVGNERAETKKELAETQFLLNSTTKELNGIKTELVDTHFLLNDTKKELYGTKTELADIKKELVDTQSELAIMDDYERVGMKLAVTKKELAETQFLLNSTTKELNGTKTELADTQSLLNDTKKELNGTKTELAKTQFFLDRTETERNGTKTELAETKTEFSKTQFRLNHTKKELVNTQSLLNDTNKELFETKAELAETKVTLGKTYGKVDHANILLKCVSAQLCVMANTDMCECPCEPRCDKCEPMSTKKLVGKQLDAAIKRLSADRLASRERLAATETALLDTKILLNDTQAELDKIRAEDAEPKITLSKLRTLLTQPSL